MSRYVYEEYPLAYTKSDVFVRCDVPLVKQQGNTTGKPWVCGADARYETSVHDVCEAHLITLFKRGTIAEEEVKDLLMEEVRRKMERRRGQKGMFTGLIRLPGRERRESIRVKNSYTNRNKPVSFIQEYDLEV